jgi:hypothetical protein
MIREDNRCMVSGARVWIHPSHCPAYDLDPDIYYAFDDCDCNHGKRVFEREGHEIVAQCKQCWDRHNDHPLVKRFVNAQKVALWRHMIASERGQLRYDELMADGTERDEDDIQAIADELTAAIDACAKDNEKLPDIWPAIPTALRRELFANAPEGLSDTDMICTMVFVGEKNKEE